MMTIPAPALLATVNVGRLHASQDTKDQREGGGNECVLCGRPTTRSTRRRWAAFVGGGLDLVAPSETTEAEAAAAGLADFMGLHPVGPECAKRMQRAGVPAEWLVGDDVMDALEDALMEDWEAATDTGENDRYRY